MNKTKHINQLAAATKADTTELKAKGISLHEENYTEKMWYLSLEFDAIIRMLSDKHGPNFNKTKDENGSTAFERRLRKRLMECTLTYDGVRDFEALVRRTFERTTREFYKRRTSYAKDEKSYEEITSSSPNEGESKKVVQFADHKENVEDNVEKSELIDALLEKYGQDSKRRYIISRFMDEKGLSVSDLAREMSGHDKGTEFNSSRQFITRFIKDMRSFIESYTA